MSISGDRLSSDFERTEPYRYLLQVLGVIPDQASTLTLVHGFIHADLEFWPTATPKTLPQEAGRQVQAAKDEGYEPAGTPVFAIGILARLSERVDDWPSPPADHSDHTLWTPLAEQLEDDTDRQLFEVSYAISAAQPSLVASIGGQDNRNNTALATSDRVNRGTAMDYSPEMGVMPGLISNICQESAVVLGFMANIISRQQADYYQRQQTPPQAQ